MPLGEARRWVVVAARYYAMWIRPSTPRRLLLNRIANLAAVAAAVQRVVSALLSSDEDLAGLVFPTTVSRLALAHMLYRDESHSLTPEQLHRPHMAAAEVAAYAPGTTRYRTLSSSSSSSSSGSSAGSNSASTPPPAPAPSAAPDQVLLQWSAPPTTDRRGSVRPVDDVDALLPAGDVAELAEERRLRQQQAADRAASVARDIAEVCVEAYQAQCDSITRAIGQVQLDLESADAHARLVLNASRNTMWTSQVYITAITAFFNALLLVGNYLGQNLGNRRRPGLADNHNIFLAVVIAATSSVAIIAASSLFTLWWLFGRTSPQSTGGPAGTQDAAAALAVSPASGKGSAPAPAAPPVDARAGRAR